MNETDIRNRIATVVLVKHATPHEAADRILALIAEAMLSDEAVQGAYDAMYGPAADDDFSHMPEILAGALAAAGITPGDAREGGEVERW